jgi:hypothetical protein
MDVRRSRPTCHALALVALALPLGVLLATFLSALFGRNHSRSHWHVSSSLQTAVVALMKNMNTELEITTYPG